MVRRFILLLLSRGHWSLVSAFTPLLKLITTSRVMGTDEQVRSLYDRFWAAVPKGWCSVGHRGKFLYIRPFFRPHILPLPHRPKYGSFRSKSTLSDIRSPLSDPKLALIDPKSPFLGLQSALFGSKSALYNRKSTLPGFYSALFGLKQAL